MGKRHGFLGFLTFFVMMFSLGTAIAASASDCVSGEYFDGSACVSCSAATGGAYPSSDAGADSINKCYALSEIKCKSTGATCPENGTCKRVVSNTKIPYKSYYDGSNSGNVCPLTGFSCKSDYYLTTKLRMIYVESMGKSIIDPETVGDLGCDKCENLSSEAAPGVRYTHSDGYGINNTCYNICTPAHCEPQACPENSTCENEFGVVNASGALFYPNPNTPDYCFNSAGISCNLKSVTCDTGYSYDFGTVTCNVNTLTIKYDVNGGNGSVSEHECIYNQHCVSAMGDGLSRDNWEFNGWNTMSDGTGSAYGAGADITNIISEGEITLYAQWRQLSTTCEKNMYYDGNNLVDCPIGSYCDGEGEAPAGEAGCSQPCPPGGTSLGGSGEKSQCFVECPAPTNIKNGYLSRVHDKEYNSGAEDDNTYPECRYKATCDPGYIAVADGATSQKCVWADASQCPVGYYCPDGAEEPERCPPIRDDDDAPRGTTAGFGARAETECYYIFEPWDDFRNGNAAAKCNWLNDESRYSDCKFDRAYSCLPGYYQLTAQTVGCRGVQQGYYSDGIEPGCTRDNYTTEECMASLTQKACPDKDTDPTVSSAEYATSKTQCNKACIKTDDHGTVSVAHERVYVGDDGQYQSCQFTVTCDSGYEAKENETENAYCSAKNYTITLNKNGGTGDVDASVQCTFDSGECNLPSVVGLVRDGYSVVPQWCTGADGTGTCYIAGTQVSGNISSNGDDITLYAVWKPNVYKILLDDMGADTQTVVPNIVYLKYATGWFADEAAQNPITKLNTSPKKSAYAFAGFFNSDETLRIIDTNGNLLVSDQVLKFTVTDNTRINAKWDTDFATCAPGTYYTGHGAQCVECKENHYCLGGSFVTDSGVDGLDECTDGGQSAKGATTASKCFKSGQSYTAEHGAGTQTCYYDEDARTYAKTENNECWDMTISSCKGGYWLDTDKTSTDCSPVGDGFFSGEDSIEASSCPKEDSLQGHTGKNNAVSNAECFLEDRVYDLDNGGAQYGSGTQTCYYNVGSGRYNDRCIEESINITYCVAGYWLDVSQNTKDCVPVGEDKYSEPGEIVVHGCPSPKKAESGTPNTRGNETSGSATECFLTRELTDTQHGRGHWGCFFNDDEAVQDYTNCSNPEMYECEAGYYYDARTNPYDCVPVGPNCYSHDYDTGYSCCDAGYMPNAEHTACTSCLPGMVCNDRYPGGKSCSDITGGEFMLSAQNTADEAFCYKPCGNSAHVAEMEGYDYYTATDTCKIKRCEDGYLLQGNSCVACPAGYYCDGGVEHSCADVDGGKWPESEQGQHAKEGCFARCTEEPVINGRRVPLTPIANYPNECEYRGVSNQGNDCEIVDNVCRETSCINIYEMKDGICVPCNRENALSYAADGNCVIASCVIGYHVEGGVCVENTRECSVPHGVVATQTWDARQNSYGTCLVTECEDGYHVASNACVLDIQSCDIEHGVGEQEWNHHTHAWGDCVAKSCDAGYTSDPTKTNELAKPCGQCKNKFAALGQVAVSSWVRECEIASCMYQGELYNLENNECVPICSIDGVEDETGTMRWNQAREKCVRECKPGYLSW